MPEPTAFLDRAALYRTPLRTQVHSMWTEHIPFGMLIVGLLGPDVLVELGTHWGQSYCAFCQTVAAEGLATKCFAVDTWAGDPNAGFYDDGCYNDLKAYHDPLYAGFSTLLRMRFDEAVTQFQDGSIDLLHIDGLHTYDAVRHDWTTWQGKLSDRAVALFHDTRVFDRDFGVHRLWAELSPQYPSFNFHHGYGLGVLAVGRAVPRDVLDFLAYAAAHPETTRLLFARLGEGVKAAADRDNPRQQLQRYLGQWPRVRSCLRSARHAVRSVTGR